MYPGSGGEEASEWLELVERSFPGSRRLREFDGVPVEELAREAGAEGPLLVLDELPSTQDAAHLLGAHGAPAGSVLVAERQSAGRGRLGRSWSSGARGVWLTLLDRPVSREALGVLSLRIGLLLSEALEPLAEGAARVKWPNDIHVSSGKLAGILVEARWREDRPEWVAAGIGVNVLPPDVATGGSLRAGVTRAMVLPVVVRAVRDAMEGGGALSDRELSAWSDRDLASGRRCSAPVEGTVVGISRDGALKVRDSAGVERAVHAGSLVFADEPGTGDGQ